MAVWVTVVLGALGIAALALWRISAALSKRSRIDLGEVSRHWVVEHRADQQER